MPLRRCCVPRLLQSGKLLKGIRSSWGEGGGTEKGIQGFNEGIQGFFMLSRVLVIKLRCFVQELRFPSRNSQKKVVVGKSSMAKRRLKRTKSLERRQNKFVIFDVVKALLFVLKRISIDGNFLLLFV